jgi:hypothetical protein
MAIEQLHLVLRAARLLLRGDGHSQILIHQGFSAISCKRNSLPDCLRNATRSGAQKNHLEF